MNEGLGYQFTLLANRFLALSVREQVLILLVGVIVIAMSLYTFLLEPTVIHTNKIKKNTVQAVAQQQELMRQSADISKLFSRDPNMAVRERIATLDKEITLLDNELQSQTSNLVPANQMADLLEKVLMTSTGIQLISLESILPTPLFLQQTQNEQAAPAPDLYRHGVKITLEGQYFDVQKYLQALEALPWKFYWKKFDYRVEQYPKGQVEFEIYTLSTSQAFIGV